MSRESKSPVELGGGIRFCHAADAAVGPGEFVFLDKLILPCRVSKLTPEQILIVNRYRESLAESAGEEGRAFGSRRMFFEIIRRFPFRSILEFGCGNFPISPAQANNSYACIEFDPVALENLQAKGFVVYQPHQFSALCASGQLGQFDALVASFSMHFRLSEDLVSDMVARLSPAGLMAFNVIAEDGLDILSKLGVISRHGLKLRILKAESFARREFLVLGSRRDQVLFNPVIDHAVLSS